MGFGTLFIGYFFLINISYFGYTDIIAAMIMLMGLYKLSSVNRAFLTSCVFSALFALFSLGELISEIINTFIPGTGASVLLNYVSVPRYILLTAITVTMLRGIYEVASEVDARELAIRTRVTMPFSFIYLLLAIFDIPEIAAALGKAAAYIYLALIISTIAVVAVNLVTIYRAYMQICMPDEPLQKEKPSRFSFVNKFRAYEEAKSREYAEYKLGKAKEKSEKKKNRKKK